MVAPAARSSRPASNVKNGMAQTKLVTENAGKIISYSVEDGTTDRTINGGLDELDAIEKKQKKLNDEFSHVLVGCFSHDCMA